MVISYSQPDVSPLPAVSVLGVDIRPAIIDFVEHQTTLCLLILLVDLCKRGVLVLVVTDVLIHVSGLVAEPVHVEVALVDSLRAEHALLFAEDGGTLWHRHVV